MPSFTSILSFAALAALARAITVTAPAKNTLWDSSKSNTVSWSSVSTDPQNVDIYLAHMAAQPPLYSLLFANVPISKGSVTVSGLQLPNGDAYQINLVAHDKPEQIYAQSQQFNVTGEGVAATSTVDGYTGPTHTPSANEGSTKTGSKTLATLVTSTTTFSNGTAATTTSNPTASDASTPKSQTSGGSANAQVSASGSATNGTSRPTPTPNAAVGSIVASAPLAALVFGFMALFM